MPCGTVMIKDIVSATPDMTVADAMVLFDKHNIRAVPVVDKAGDLVGIFDMRLLLLHLLPLPLTDEDDFIGNTGRTQFLSLSLDHFVDAAPWVARRLQSLMKRTLEGVMEKEPPSIEEDAPLREGIRLLALHGSPLPVVAEGGNRLIGLISSQSILHGLMDIQQQIMDGKVVEE